MCPIRSRPLGSATVTYYLVRLIVRGADLNRSDAQELCLLGLELGVGQHARLAQLTELLELRKLVSHVRRS